MKEDGGVAAMIQVESALRLQLSRTQDALRTLVAETLDAIDAGAPPDNFGGVMRALRAAADALEVPVGDATSVRDQELRDLTRWIRDVNAADGNPDLGLEMLLRLIEIDKPHRGVRFNGVAG